MVNVHPVFGKKKKMYTVECNIQYCIYQIKADPTVWTKLPPHTHFFNLQQVKMWEMIAQAEHISMKNLRFQINLI